MARGAVACLADIDTVILAGGPGTRLRSALPDLPKVLAPVGGRAFLAFILDWLGRFGARRIVLSLGYKAESVTQYLALNERQEMEIVPVIEQEPLGTGGAVRLASKTCSSSPVLVVNGDTMVEADLCSFVAAHRRAGVPMSLMYASVEDARRFGRLVIANGRIQQFKEKDAGYGGAAKVSAGVYLFERSALDAIPEGGVLSLETDVLGRLLPGTVAAWGQGVRFLDIGTPESFLEANAVLSKEAWRE